MPSESSALHVSPTPPKSGAGRLTLLYIAALSAVALLSLVGQAVVRVYFNRELSDSQVINIAGRQRMLCQRIAKSALAAGTTIGNVDRAVQRSEFAAALELWQRSHRGLLQGDAELGLPGQNSQVVQRMFAELEPSFRGMLSAAEIVSQSSPDSPPSLQRSDAVADIMRYEPVFLRGMDTIVSQYAAEASRRVLLVERIELALLLVTLTVLLLEGLFVFRPAVRRIRAMLAALEVTGVKLAAARDAAESASQAKSRFLAVTSHELRTPLHAILGIAEQLQKTPLADPQRQGITVVQDAGKTLLVLVNDLLDLARIESGKLDLNMQTVSLASVLEGAVALIRPVAEDKGLEISAEIDPKIPAGIVTDPLRLGQVLLNLLGNAVKFTDQGSVRLMVEHLAERGDSAQLQFSVIDTGIGIPPDEQERVFQSFTQVDGSRHRACGGAGLGLAIARSLVELLGGNLTLESQLGQGSRFSFTINCEEAAVATTGCNAEELDENHGLDQCGKTIGFQRSCDSHLFHSSHEGSNGHPVSHKLQSPVLVVDDAAANRLLAATILSGAGYDVDAVSSGEEALKLIVFRTYRAIVLDIHMPGMDGFELARAVRQFESDNGRRRCLLVALTADAVPDSAANLPPHTIDVVLHKPASEQSILSALAGASSFYPLDSRSLARLAGNRALLTELSSLFAREAISQRVEIEDGLQRSDGRAVSRAVHRLRGQALMFDADDLCHLLAEIEEKATAGQIRECNVIWGSAAQQIDTLCDELAL